MATRVVEGKKPYTGGEAIDIDQNKVISLKLRDENNLIIYDSGDNEIYVDLQLPDGITPTDAFPVGVTTGRAVVADGWDKAGTIICAKTTSGDNIKLLYADDGTLWIDNGTGTFKQIYFKADVDALITTLTTYINTELAKKQNGVVSETAPSNPSEGDLWYDTTNSAMKVWDGTAWQSVGTGGGSDIEYVTQVEYDALPSSKLTDGKHYVIYTEDSPTPPSPGWQPGVNTVAYWRLDGDTTDSSGNSRDLSVKVGSISYGTLAGGQQYGVFDGSTILNTSSRIPVSTGTILCWLYRNNDGLFFCDNVDQNNSNDYITVLASASITTVAAIYSPNGFFEVNKPTPSQWFLYALTQDGGEAIYYVNGVQDGTRSNSLFLSDSNGNQWCVGGLGRGTQYYDRWDGYISDLIIEDKVRTAQEIADYFNQTKANYGIS